MIVPPSGGKSYIWDGDVIALFHANLTAIREWYRLKPSTGVEYGHFILLELCISDVISALSAAMEGKPWQPPQA